VNVGELRVSDGGMLKCSEDRPKSWEEHSKRQSRGTSPWRRRCSEYGPAWKFRDTKNSSHVPRAV